MSHKLDTEITQQFNAYNQGKLILSFTIAPVHKVFRKKDFFSTEEHTTLDSLLAELQEWKAKGVTDIESYNYGGGFSYTEYESDESLSKRKEQYELDLKEQEKAYDLAFSVCHLVSIGDFAEAERELTKLRNTKSMYNLKEC